MKNRIKSGIIIKTELFKSDFKAIAEFFYALNNRTVYHPTEQILKYPEEVIDMISVFSGDERFRNEYNSMIKQGGINMCEIYDQILKEGEKKEELREELRAS